MNFIWFDFSPSERRIERIFLRPQLPSVRLRDDMPPWNKQTNRSLQMIFVCEKNTWLHMLVWVSFFHIVWAFLFLCLCMCVCVHKAGDRSVLQLADTQYSNSWAPARRRSKAQAAGEVTGAQDFPLAPQSTFNLYCQLFLTHTHSDTYPYWWAKTCYSYKTLHVVFNTVCIWSPVSLSAVPSRLRSPRTRRGQVDRRGANICVSYWDMWNHQGVILTSCHVKNPPSLLN